MREKNPNLRRTPAIFSGDRRRSYQPTSSSPRRHTFLPLRRPNRLKSLRILSRSASDPILLRFTGEIEGNRSFDSMILLPCLNTCNDLISPSRWPKSSAAMFASMEEVKVIVSVAVEGSPGPVRAMVRLGASVEEAIGVVVRQYGSEGRRPRLDLQATASFQLHHSHFTLKMVSFNVHCHFKTLSLQQWLCTFGVWKKKWAILRDMPQYSLERQRDIVIATMALHNYIRRHPSRSDIDFRASEEEMSSQLPETHHQRRGESSTAARASTSQVRGVRVGVDEMIAMRDSIAEELYRDST